ncbi:MAG: hypothetical protein KGM24_11225 [Elusimicrobia bacterium]|nr:hypothetical protein [Elusimicrobiota bacterium]
MRKTKAAVLLLLAAALGASAAVAATITVLVRETRIRRRPQFYAPAVATARLGEKFDAEGPENGWYKTARGYIHESAVTAKRVRVDSAGSVGGGASAEELTLAGKGFNAQVESAYAAGHPNADYRAVDAMARRTVSDAELLRFAREGGLAAGRGEDR